VIYNTPEMTALPTSDAELSPVGEFSIGFVGVLSTVRGLKTLFDVLERRPHWRAHIAGYGTDDLTIERKLKDLPNISFHGKVSFSEALKIYSQSNVILCTYDPTVPNHRYSSPNKLAEALMLGKPLIVALGTNVDRVVEAKNLGCVVPYGDVSALESALASIASWTPDTARRFAERARALYFQEYSWQSMGRAFTKLLDDIATHLF
jgi:glycosyltransferase involved in cell wall biosynthesis